MTDENAPTDGRYSVAEYRADIAERSALAAAGRIANEHAARGAFADYCERKAANTLRSQRADLSLWAEYIRCATNGNERPDVEALMTSPDAWRGVTWGLVGGFVRWLLAQGYAVASINRALATVRIYVRLAEQAGAISQDEAALIRLVRGYGGKDAKRVDERRELARRGAKKPQNVLITPEQAAALKRQPDSPQGRRDAVIMALLLDHGLRVGELVGLRVGDFDLAAGVFTFYRPKVDKTQTHRLTPDAARALANWLAVDLADAPPSGPLLRGSRKGGALAGAMSERAVCERVRRLGEAVGLTGLSPHDCRHYWATRAASQGTDPFALRDAGGWSSLAMPSRYVEAATIANERVRL